jgi:hypothetical protein
MTDNQNRLSIARRGKGIHHKSQRLSLSVSKCLACLSPSWIPVSGKSPPSHIANPRSGWVRRPPPNLWIQRGRLTVPTPPQKLQGPRPGTKTPTSYPSRYGGTGQCLSYRTKCGTCTSNGRFNLRRLFLSLTSWQIHNAKQKSTHTYRSVSGARCKFQTTTGFVISSTAPVARLLQAESVTLWARQRGATIHHTACGSWFCPVQALARRVSQILLQGCPASTPLSFVSPGVRVVASNVTNLIQHAAIETNLVAQGYDLKQVSTHSLRASGAMALKLQGVDDSLIMKIG